MTPVKTPVKSLEVKEDGLIYASPLEKPIEPNPTDFMLEERYQHALKLYTSSLIKVENKEFLLQNKIIPYIIKEETIIAPDGLCMEVKEETTYHYTQDQIERGEVPMGESIATTRRTALCSFLPDKEEEKPKVEHWAIERSPEGIKVYKNGVMVQPINKTENERISAFLETYKNSLSELKEDVGEEKLKAKIHEAWDKDAERIYPLDRRSYEAGYKACLLSPQEKPEKEQTKLWQCCPKCGGSGMAMNFKNQIPTTFDTCDVCNGTKIISTLTGLPPNPPKA